MRGEHTFQEYIEQVEKYRLVAAEIADLDSILHFKMVRVFFVELCMSNSAM